MRYSLAAPIMKRRNKYNQWLAPSPEREPTPKIPRTTTWRLDDTDEGVQAAGGDSGGEASATDLNDSSGDDEVSLVGIPDNDFQPENQQREIDLESASDASDGANSNNDLNDSSGDDEVSLVGIPDNDFQPENQQQEIDLESASDASDGANSNNENFQQSEDNGVSPEHQGLEADLHGGQRHQSCTSEENEDEVGDAELADDCNEEVGCVSESGSSDGNLSSRVDDYEAEESDTDASFNDSNIDNEDSPSSSTDGAETEESDMVESQESEIDDVFPAPVGPGPHLHDEHQQGDPAALQAPLDLPLHPNVIPVDEDQEGLVHQDEGEPQGVQLLLPGHEGVLEDGQHPEDLAHQPYFSDAFQNLKAKLRGPLGEKIPHQPQISAAEFLLNTLTMVTHFKMNFAQFEGTMKLVNTLFRSRVLPDTRYLLDKLFMAIAGIHYHFVCSYCKDYLGEYDHTIVHEVVCENCGRSTVIENLNDCIFFVLFDLPSQLEVMFCDDNVFESLKNPFDLLLSNVGEDFCMKDVYDGSMYQNFVKSLGRRSTIRHLSTVCSIDGASPYDSSGFQIWPIFNDILELAPKFRAHKLLLAGLWFGRGHPTMDVFLLPYADKCKQWSEHGFTIIRKGEEIQMKLHCLGCCADAPARAAVQCIHQHGGSFACHWCLHPSENRRFDVLNYEPEKRTKEEMINDASMVLAMEQEDASVNGVTGLSPLISIPTFHIIDGILLEYFHAACHGVCKTIMGAWLGEDGADVEENPFYIGSPDTLKKLNKMIKSIHLPVEARRILRDLIDWAYWKGRDLENFMLYVSVPLLEHILPRRFLSHWILFVQAMHFLLQDTVTERHRSQAQALLRSYGLKVAELYPQRHMTYNNHIVSEHLAEHCKRWGPLWCVNGYTYENGIRILNGKIYSSNGVASQICRALSHSKSLEILRAQVSTPFTKKFQDDIEKKKVTNCIYVLKDKYLGIAKKFHPTNEEVFILNQERIDHGHFVEVPKLLHNGCLYTAQKKSSQTDNSVALLENSDVILVQRIIVSEELGQGYLIGKKVVSVPHLPAQGIAREDCFLRSISRINQQLVLITPMQLQIVCARITLCHGDYIIKVPNVHNTT